MRSENYLIISLTHLSYSPTTDYRLPTAYSRRLPIHHHLPCLYRPTIIDAVEVETARHRCPFVIGSFPCDVMRARLHLAIEQIADRPATHIADPDVHRRSCRELE